LLFIHFHSYNCARLPSLFTSKIQELLQHQRHSLSATETGWTVDTVHEQNRELRTTDDELVGRHKNSWHGSNCKAWYI